MPLSDLEVNTPKWWLAKLTEGLLSRQSDMAAYRNLVDGVHADPQSAETSAKFARIANLATTNLTGVAIEATAERMNVEGVRIGDAPDADKKFWDDVWQRSDFDAGSQDAITSALIFGRSFVSVSPPSGDTLARLHYEDPQQVIVAHDPETDEAVAALKVWDDEWTGQTFATLYLPNVIVKLVRQGTPVVAGTQLQDPAVWLARDITSGDVVSRNPLGVVPFFELRNKPLGLIQSEVDPLVKPQLRLNQHVFNTDAVAEFGAFRQKWATGMEIPKDPITGLPVQPFEAHLAKMFTATGDGRFGNFEATDLSGYIALGQEIAAHISRVSRVPITYFLSNISNLGGDALALLISGLVLKCQRRVKGYEPALEGASRLALRAMGDPRADVANIEIKWAEMETRSMAQAADAAQKLVTGDVITAQTAQERYLGMSQTERDRDDAWREQPDADAARRLSAAEAVQKVYLGVGTVLTTDEARQLVNDVGGDLPIPGPPLSHGSQ